MKNQASCIKWKLSSYAPFQVRTLISSHKDSLNFDCCQIQSNIQSNITIIFHFEPHFCTCSLHDRKVMSRFIWKNGQKMAIFHVFLGDQAKFFGFPLEYLKKWANFWKFIKFLKFWSKVYVDSTIDRQQLIANNWSPTIDRRTIDRQYNWSPVKLIANVNFLKVPRIPTHPPSPPRNNPPPTPFSRQY